MTPFEVSLGVSLLLSSVSVPLLRRASLIDRPNHRSSHVVPVPRGGGVAVMLAVLVAAAIGGVSEVWPVLGPALLLAAVGLADDLRSLSARFRLAGQVLVGVVACAWIAAAAPVEGSTLPLFLVLGTIGYVGFVNAFNFMDGINGISALHATVAGAWFAWLGHSNDLSSLMLLGVVTAGAALGFLPPNILGRVFLGDVGSYGIGALLAGAALAAYAGGVSVPLAVAPLVVYLADTGWVMARRAREGKRLTEAHREHAYQRLVQQGWPHPVVATWSAVVSGMIVWVMGALHRDHELLATSIVALLVAAYLATPRLTAQVATSRRKDA